MPHRLDRIGGGGESQLRVEAVRPVMVEVSEKLAYCHAHLACGQRLAYRDLQTPERSLKLESLRELQRLAGQLVQCLSDGPSSQGGLLPTAAPLQLADEVKMTELQDPAILASQRLHPAKVVGDQGSNSALDLGWKRLQDLAPALGILAATAQHGIQKHRIILGRGFERHQIQDPRLAAETKPQAVDQEDEGPAWIFAGTRVCEKLKQRLAKAIPDGLRRPAGMAAERAKSLVRQKDAVHDVRSDSETRPPSSFRPNPPGSPTAAALSPPQPVRIHSRTTTWRFRVYGFHARELST